MTDEARDEALDAEEQEDVEGHAKLGTEDFRLANEESDEDVEGHAKLGTEDFRLANEESDEEVEGHMALREPGLSEPGLS